LEDFFKFFYEAFVFVFLVILERYKVKMQTQPSNITNQVAKRNPNA